MMIMFLMMVMVILMGMMLLRVIICHEKAFHDYDCVVQGHNND